MRVLSKWFIWVSGATLVFTILGCPNREAGFESDPNSPNSTGTVGGCNPTISDLKFAQGEWEKLGDYVRVSFSYGTKCSAKETDGEVTIKVTNMDLPDPEADEASATYYFGTSNSKYVDYNSSSDTMWVDFKISEDSTATTFTFEVKFKDSKGYWSNALEEEIVYAELTESVD